MPRRFWLMKCEPETYSISDLERDGRTTWEGIRNYQSRNFLRDDVQEGDGVLFYASNAEPSGVSGVATVARAGYPDPFAWKRGNEYFDAASTPEKPVWYAVDLAFAERFPALVPLETLKATPGLEKMMVVQRGSRLSIQPVTNAEWEIVLRIGRSAGGATDDRARSAARRSPAKRAAGPAPKRAAGRAAKRKG